MELKNWLRRQLDRVAAVACLIAGAAVLLGGWIGVSSYAYPANQLPYIAGPGLGGLFLLGVGAGLWLSADLVDEWHKLDRLERELREQTALLRQAVGLSQGSATGAVGTPGPAPDQMHSGVLDASLA